MFCTSYKLFGLVSVEQNIDEKQHIQYTHSPPCVHVRFVSVSGECECVSELMSAVERMFITVWDIFSSGNPNQLSQLLGYFDSLNRYSRFKSLLNSW